MYNPLSSFMALFSCMLSSGAFADEIKLFIWEDYLSKDVISQFEKQSGHTIKQVYFDSEMLRDAVVYSGKVAAYDLVILDGYTLREFGQQGLLGELDDISIKSLRVFSDDATEACGRYGVPYAHGTIGVGYRTSKVDVAFTSWMDIFEYARTTPGKLIIPDEDIDTTAIALMALGYHPMTDKESELREAYQLLDSVLDNLLAFRNSAGYALEKKHDSEMDVAVIYSGEKESISNNTGQHDWKYVIPDDGTLVWYECLSSHIDNPMSKATVEFINYLNRPDIAAKNAEDVWFATANKEALKLVSDEYMEDSELFPKGLSVKKTYQYKKINDISLRLRDHIITTLSGK